MLFVFRYPRLPFWCLLLAIGGVICWFSSRDSRADALSTAAGLEQVYEVHRGETLTDVLGRWSKSAQLPPAVINPAGSNVVFVADAAFTGTLPKAVDTLLSAIAGGSEMHWAPKQGHVEIFM